MFNLKWGVTAGAAAFVLSLAVGLVSGSGILPALLRAGIFAALFFGIGAGIWAIISNFIPELLDADSFSPGGASAPDGGIPRPGSRINITLEDSRGGALPENYRNSGENEDVGNISDLFSGKASRDAPGPAGVAPEQGMDQKGEDGYTGSEGGGQESHNQEIAENRSLPGGNAPVFTPSFGESDGVGDLPDLDAMAGAFLANPGESAAPEAPVAAGGTVRMDISPPVRGVSSKGQTLEGDYSPKELAEGIHTILTKEKEKG